MNKFNIGTIKLLKTNIKKYLVDIYNINKYEVIREHTNCNVFDLNTITKKYMCIYGVNNVRGGSYKDNIPKEIYNELVYELIYHNNYKLLINKNKNKISNEFTASNYIKYDHNLYILKLENNKYLVAMADHISKPLEWTIKNPIISIDRIIPNSDTFMMDTYTKKYMLIHGINNVRGGRYLDVILPQKLINYINFELKISEEINILEDNLKKLINELIIDIE